MAQQSVGNIEKKKVTISLQLRTGHVVVHEYHDLQMIWSRSNKKVSSKKLFVDENTRTQVFKENFNCTTTLSYSVNDGQFIADENRLALMLGSQEVGTCTFDISPFINRSRKMHKAEMKPLSYETRAEEMVLKGDAERYPGAYIEFTFKVEETERVNRDSQMHQSAAGSVRNSSQPTNNLIDDAQVQKDTAIEQVRGKYQPKIDSLNQLLDKYKRQHEDLISKRDTLKTRIAENSAMNAGDEARQIRRRRDEIARIYEEIKREKERQAELKAQLRAYNEIQLELGQNPTEAQLFDMLKDYEAEKVKLQKQLENSFSVKMQKQMYEIEFDAY